MTDKIEVFYKATGFGVEIVYHKYIVYTKNVGEPNEEQFAARGGGRLRRVFYP